MDARLKNGKVAGVFAGHGMPCPYNGKSRQDAGATRGALYGVRRLAAAVSSTGLAPALSV
jgi:hypothetical protein